MEQIDEEYKYKNTDQHSQLLTVVQDKIVQLGNIPPDQVDSLTFTQLLHASRFNSIVHFSRQERAEVDRVSCNDLSTVSKSTFFKLYYLLQRIEITESSLTLQS